MLFDKCRISRERFEAKTLRFGEGFLYFFLIPNIQFLKRSVRKQPSIVNGSDRTGLLQGLEIQVLETYVIRDSSYQGTPL